MKKKQQQMRWYVALKLHLLSDSKLQIVITFEILL